MPRRYWTVEAEAAGQDGIAVAATLVPAGRRRRSARPGWCRRKRAAQDAAKRIRAGPSRSRRSSAARCTGRQPLPPFTTATLQQEAARRLGFGIGETMAVAQRLYEGVDLGDETAGLVTYMRTDSTAMAATAVAQARAVVRRAFGDDYVPARSRMSTGPAPAHVQEAHEAIRPTDFERTPEELGGAPRPGGGAALRPDPRPGAGQPDAGGPVRPGAAGDRLEAGDIVLEASGFVPRIRRPSPGPGRRRR